MSHAMLANGTIRPHRSPDPDEGIAPILIRIPAVERHDRAPLREGQRRRRLRREVRGVLWVSLGIALGWAFSTARSTPAPAAAVDPGPVLVRLSIEAEPTPSSSTEEPAQPIALKGFVLPSESR